MMLSKRLNLEGSFWDLSSLAKDCRVQSGSPVANRRRSSEPDAYQMPKKCLPGVFH